MILLALLASLSFGASTDTLNVPLEDALRLNNLSVSVEDLLGGRYRQTGKPTFAGGICFSDGTCQTTAPSSSLNFASATVTSGFTTTQTNTLVCVTGSTVALQNASAAKPVWISVAGSISNSVYTANMWAQVLEDGLPITPYANPASVGPVMMGQHANDAGGLQGMSFTLLLRAPTSGQRNYCLAVAGNTGTTSACNSRDGCSITVWQN